MATAQVEGQDGMTTVTEGDYVCFKSDVEQSGQIEAIGYHNGRPTLTLISEYGFQGGYIGGETMTVESASDCWVEG